MEKHNIKSVDDLVARKIPTRFATLKAAGTEFVVNAVFRDGFGVDYRRTSGWGGSVEYASYSAARTSSLTSTLTSLPSVKIASIVMQIESQVDIVILPMEQTTSTRSASHRHRDLHGGPRIYKSVTEPVKVVGTTPASWSE